MENSVMILLGMKCTRNLYIQHEYLILWFIYV